jgi:hypothetical protein
MADIHHLISIAASVEMILPLVSTGDGFRKWWAEDTTEISDALVELAFFNRATVWRFRRHPSSSGSETLWTCETGTEWKGTSLRFKLAPDKNGSMLRFSHLDWPAESDFFTACNTTWGGLMFRLKSAAEGKNSGPLFSKSGVGY